MSPRVLLPLALLVTSLLSAPLSTISHAQTREEKVREDRKRVEADGYWNYNDLPAAFAEAKRSGKPVLVVFRCIPCEECVKLDEELMEKDPELKPLLDKYVRARQVSTNGIDLSLFQFDFDQSFAVFMLNGDGTIYGRFGTRSHRTDWVRDVSIKGLAEALRGALALHAEYPANKQALAGKRGEPLAFPAPEKYPLLRGKFGPALNYDGDVVKSCIHCHQVGDALREHHFTSADGNVSDRVLYQYTHPKALGLILDPTAMCKVTEVVEGSPAAASGFKAGDEIVTLEGQPMLSIADVQWVLHNVTNEKQVTAVVRRNGKEMSVALQLPEGWRQLDDISWRVTSWPMRRMATGGLKLEPATAEERQAAGIDSDGMALFVRHVGRYGPHAAAFKAGFRQGDILVSFDGQTDLDRESDLMAHALRNHKPGDKVPVGLIRNKRRMQLSLPIQE